MLLTTRIVEKVWGRTALPPVFAATGGRSIGEIWFEPPPGLADVLVKFIFTSQKLSIQCHPSDRQTEAMGLGRQGKDECWLVIDAEPGAMLGIGFREAVAAQAMRAAARDGSIVDLLAWHEVRRGDFFSVPANTVHAIGGGCAIIEVQQNSDLTYRLFDYGRERELHLEQALEVASGAAFDPALHRRLPERGEAALLSGPTFQLDRVEGAPSAALARRCCGPLLVLPLTASVGVTGLEVTPGACALAPELAAIDFAATGQCLLVRPGLAPAAPLHTTPKASMASATFLNPAMLAPLT